MQALKYKAGLLLVMGYINLFIVPACVYFMFTQTEWFSYKTLVFMFIAIIFLILGIICVYYGYKDYDIAVQLEKEKREELNMALRKMRESSKQK